MSNFSNLTLRGGKLGAQVAGPLQGPVTGDFATITALEAADGTVKGLTAYATGFYVHPVNDGQILAALAAPTSEGGVYPAALATTLAGASVVGLRRFTTIPDGAQNIIVATQGQCSGNPEVWDAVTGQTGGLTPGAYYFLSDATPGHLTTTPPATIGHYVMKIGLALSSAEMLLQIGTPVIVVGG